MVIQFADRATIVRIFFRSMFDRYNWKVEEFYNLNMLEVSFKFYFTLSPDETIICKGLLREVELYVPPLDSSSKMIVSSVESA